MPPLVTALPCPMRRPRLSDPTATASFIVAPIAWAVKNLTNSSTDFSVLPIQCQRTKIGPRLCSSPGRRIGRADAIGPATQEGTPSVPQVCQPVLTTAGPPMTSTPRSACNSTVISGIKTRLADRADPAWRCVLGGSAIVQPGSLRPREQPVGYISA